MSALTDLAAELRCNVIAREVTVDAETMETVAHRYGLDIEIGGDKAYLELEGLTFVADLTAVA